MTIDTYQTQNQQTNGTPTHIQTGKGKSRRNTEEHLKSY